MRTGGLLHRHSLCSQFLPMPSTSLHLHHHVDLCCSYTYACVRYFTFQRYVILTSVRHQTTERPAVGTDLCVSICVRFGVRVTHTHSRRTHARTQARITPKTNGTRPVGTTFDCGTARQQPAFIQSYTPRAATVRGKGSAFCICCATTAPPFRGAFSRLN